MDSIEEARQALEHWTPPDTCHGCPMFQIVANLLSIIETRTAIMEVENESPIKQVLESQPNLYGERL